MNDIRTKALFGALIAVLALGVAVAAPGLAAAEGEVAPEGQAAAGLVPGEATTPEATTPEAPFGSASPLLGCFANQICTYFGEYGSFAGTYECSWSGTWSYYPGYASSARNRCGNKSNWLRWNGNVVACMNPGGDRPHPGNFNELFIPENYGAFC